MHETITDKSRSIARIVTRKTAEMTKRCYFCTLWGATIVKAMVPLAWNCRYFTGRSRAHLLHTRCFTTRRHSEWADQMQDAYDSGDTDGIIEWATSKMKAFKSESDLPTPSELFEHVSKASEGKSGRTASILHAWLAACVLEKNATYSWNLWSDIFESEEYSIQPDVLTYCLVFASQQDEGSPPDRCSHILDVAMKASKKQAGSKRRRAAAKARRHISPEDVEARVQEILHNDEFRILYDSGDTMVVSKPAGVSCFRQKGLSKREKTLEEALLSAGTCLSTLNPQARGTVHRLDRGTSGCLVLAKTEHAHAMIVTDFFCRRVQKSYSCLLESIPLIATKELTDPIAGKSARSDFQLVDTFPETSTALASVRTFTGRKHQVRIQCARELGIPILGDIKYGARPIGRSQSNVPEQDHFFLHASSVFLPYVNTEIHAPLPKEWKSVTG